MQPGRSRHASRHAARRRWHDPVTILHVITGTNVGGAETMLAKLLERCGADAVVASLLPPGPVGRRIAAAGIPVETIGMAQGMVSPLAAARLVALARRLQPALIQGWMYHGNLAASLASRGPARRPPVVWNVRHSLSDIALEKTLTRAVIRLGARVSNGPAAIIYNAEVAARQHAALGFDARRALVIPNGFDCARFRPQPGAAGRLRTVFGIASGAIVVGMVARQHPMKDAPMLAHAAALARRAGHDIHLLIVGTDMDRPSPALAAATALLPPDRVTLSGARPDVDQWLPGLDMLALPSAWGEGFPNVIGEAMACGVPCIATDVGDSASIIGTTGRVVAPCDAAMMAAAIGDLAALGAVGRRALGVRARARAEADFTIEQVTARYTALYARLTDAGDAFEPHHAPAGAACAE